MYFERLLYLNIQEWLLQHAIGDDVIPWLTLHSMKINLHYRKLFMAQTATVVNSLLLLWGYVFFVHIHKLLQQSLGPLYR